MRGRAYAAFVLASVALALDGCGDGGDGSSASWSGPPKPSADGTVDVSSFDEYESKVDETWEKTPTFAAEQFLRLDTRSASVTEIKAKSGPEGVGPSMVTVTLDGLPDDSIRSERWQLAFVPDDSTYRLLEARWSQRCRAGRGHAVFSTEPCV